MWLKSVFNPTIIWTGKTFILKPGPSTSYGILMKSLFYISVPSLSRNATKQMVKFNSVIFTALSPRRVLEIERWNMSIKYMPLPQQSWLSGW